MAQPDDLKAQQEVALAGKGPEPVGDLDGNGRQPQPLGGVWTRSLDGWGIDPRWLESIALNPDKVLTLEGYAPDLDLFDNLLDDDVSFSTFQQRRLDVISRDWIVEAGANDAQSKAAADHLRAQLQRLPWDDVCDKMLHSRWYGYGVAEAQWQIGTDGLICLGGIYIPNRAWFAFSNGGDLLLRTHENPNGESVPDRKFWLIRSGGNHDALHYGVGLAHWCYWPTYFKKNAIKFWALFLEKFGMPTMLGKFPVGWEQDETKIAKLLAALSAVGTDSAVAVPADAEVEPMEAQRSGSGASSYDEFVALQDEALTRIVLSQTMTSTAGPAGLGSGQADVQESKGLNIAQSDSDLLHESFNNTIARWLTEWNFPGAATPRVYRKLTDDEDLDAIAERDKKLDDLGWERTDESFVEVYGKGYQRKPEPVLPPALLNAQGKPGNDNQPPALRGAAARAQMAFAAQFASMDEARPLYISRKLLNPAPLLRWAREQGFTDLVDAGELHVTQVYSRKPVDWFALAARAWWSAPEKVEVIGGPRSVIELGDKPVTVLRFASEELQGRFRSLTDTDRNGVRYVGEESEGDQSAVAEHSFAEYAPHVTFANSAEGVDLAAVQPFAGELDFGPEIWEVISDPGPVVLAPVAFAAEQLDAVDLIVTAMGREGSTAIRAMVEPIREVLAGLDFAADPEALRVALLEGLERMPTDQFAMVLADPLLAVRAAEESGLGTEAVA